jgi:hypothetical protein
MNNSGIGETPMVANSVSTVFASPRDRAKPGFTSKPGFMFGWGIALVGAVCLLANPAARAAGDEGDGAKAGAARAVRLSSVDGQVQVVQDGQVIADQATTNLPLFEGSQIITGNEGRAEVQLEDGSLARLSPNSTLTLTKLTREGAGTRTVLVLNGGLAYFELEPSSAENSIRVSFDRTTFEPSGFTVVRVSEDVPPGQMAVFSGNVHVERGSSVQVDVHGGESLKLDAANLDRYDVVDTIEPDSWDSWNADRDQELNAQSAAQTAATSGSGINPAMGMSQLDSSGNWYNVPGQGYIWSPYEAQGQGVGWDPYGFGRWVYYPRFGYVWVSGYNWGYAPYQCGTWNYFDTIGWGWNPYMGAGGIGFGGMGGGGLGGGCGSPWWFGNSGWGYNLGNVPRGYRPPHRPQPGPIHPGGPTRLTRVASVAVDRRIQTAPTGPGMHGTPRPVTIAGHVVEPLRPVSTRASYEHAGASFGTKPVQPESGYVVSGSHPVYTGSNTSSTAVSGNRTFQPPPPATYHPAAPAPSRSAPAPSHQASSGYSGGGGHTFSAPSSGGGGGGHASGGGGGGGGGTHK